MSLAVSFWLPAKCSSLMPLIKLTVPPAFTWPVPPSFQICSRVLADMKPRIVPELLVNLNRIVEIFSRA